MVRNATFTSFSHTFFGYRDYHIGMSFSEKLKELRKNKGVTQEELAKKIFVSRTLITKYESGAVYPTEDNLEKLAFYFGVPVSALLEEQEASVILDKRNKLAKTANLIASIIMIFVCAASSVSLALPIFAIRRHDYSEGALPKIVTIFDNGYHLTLSHSNPIAIIALAMGCVNVALSLLSIFMPASKAIRITNRIMFLVSIVLISFSFFFCIAYSSSNLYDF